MDKIIFFVLFSTIGLISTGNAQLYCYVCNNCRDVSNLDRSVIQNCDVALGPDIPGETTSDGAITEATTVAVSVSTEFVDGTSTQTNPDVPPSITTQQPTAPPFSLRHKYKDVIRELIGSQQCFVIERQVGDEYQVNRGCIVTRETISETCSIANFGQEPSYCRICNTNECNHASKYAISLFIILSSLFVVLINRT